MRLWLEWVRLNKFRKIDFFVVIIGPGSQVSMITYLEWNLAFASLSEECLPSQLIHPLINLSQFAWSWVPLSTPASLVLKNFLFLSWLYPPMAWGEIIIIPKMKSLPWFTFAWAGEGLVETVPVVLKMFFLLKSSLQLCTSIYLERPQLKKDCLCDGCLPGCRTTGCPLLLNGSCVRCARVEMLSWRKNTIESHFWVWCSNNYSKADL